MTLEWVGQRHLRAVGWVADRDATGGLRLLKGTRHSAPVAVGAPADNKDAAATLSRHQYLLADNLLAGKGV